MKSVFVIGKQNKEGDYSVTVSSTPVLSAAISVSIFCSYILDLNFLWTQVYILCLQVIMTATDCSWKIQQVLYILSCKVCNLVAVTILTEWYCLYFFGFFFLSHFGITCSANCFFAAAAAKIKLAIYNWIMQI